MGGEHEYGDIGLLTGIQAVRLPVSDLEMAIEFYSGILKLRIVEKGERKAELAVGDGTIELYVPLEKESRRPGGPTGILLSTDSIYDFHRRMVDEGVEFVIKPLRSSGRLTATFVDDDGNEISVIDRPSRKRPEAPSPSG
jgi:catechol 2,3-dioxygenase-like lactoylglutathione lyase family enzyme